MNQRTGLTKSVPFLLMLLACLPGLAVAQDGEFSPTRDLILPAVMSVVFTLIGLLLFGFCIWLIVRLTPFSVRKEIEEDQNTSLGIIIGSMIIGIAIILAAVLHSPI